MKVFNITFEKIVKLHDKIIVEFGGDSGVLNPSSLEFAIDRVQHYSHNTTIFEDVAILLRGITQDHPFVDGNKRTGLVVAQSVLEDNDLVFNLNYDEIEEFILKVAKCEFQSIEELANYIEERTIEIWNFK
ncbi:MAG: type II toxin-antitoxin system death-on-curing family toxin [Nanoarchaeota archaeon]|nr:type II toxin-antitoxin system death-on-curing family toxin [Nanoarchaeota archaeon]